MVTNSNSKLQKWVSNGGSPVRRHCILYWVFRHHTADWLLF